MSRLLSVALLPAGILLGYIYRLDTIEKEPTRLLIRLFLFGCLCAIPASILEWVGESLISGAENTLVYLLLDAFVVVAVSEEGCKLAFLSTAWNNPAFDYRFDAIVYAVCVSMGFAALENVMYVFRYGVGTALIRAFTSVPGHCFFGVFMGYWFGRAKHARYYGLPGGGVFLALSLLVPVLLHGFYDFCCFMSGDGLFVLIFYAFLIVFFIAAVRCVRRASAGDVPISGGFDGDRFL